jgi:hypothetical protein
VVALGQVICEYYGFPANYHSTDCTIFFNHPIIDTVVPVLAMSSNNQLKKVSSSYKRRTRVRNTVYSFKVLLFYTRPSLELCTFLCAVCSVQCIAVCSCDWSGMASLILSAVSEAGSKSLITERLEQWLES